MDEARVIAAGAAGHSALVVDDDPMIRMLLRHQLVGLGIDDVSVAENADQAVDRIRAAEAPFSMIFCDLRMPGADGIELLRQLSTLSAPSALIIVSGADWRIVRSAELLAQRRQVNYIGALSKPIKRSELKVIVERALSDWAAETLRPKTSVAESGERSKSWIERALADDRVIIYVQPQVSLHTGQLHGVEVLARCENEDGTIVPPNLFIDAAEREGLMDQLTFRILEKTEEAIVHWRGQGIEPKVAVNISASTLSRLDIPERLGRSAELSRLVVELTESAVVERIDDLLDVTTRLRLRGLELSIDDFGTGYSSLSQLDTLPFTELKLDQSFVRPAIRESSARSIITNTVRMAHELGMTVVAEGVETEEHCSMVRSLGCDIAQGYFVARPMSWRALPDWVAEGHEYPCTAIAV